MLTRALTAPGTQPSSPASFYCAGVDLGKKHDFSVIAVVQKRGQEVYLRYLKRFGLETEYQSVLGYLKLLNERLQGLRRILIDQTGVGEVFVEDTVKSGLRNVQGIMLTRSSKQEVLVYLREAMEAGRLHIPYDRGLINEMNVEQFKLMKTGQMEFSHPAGMNDDRLWALALAVYTSRSEIPEYHPVALTGKIFKPWYQARTMTSTIKPGTAMVTNREMCLRCWKQKSPVRECTCKE